MEPVSPRHHDKWHMDRSNRSHGMALVMDYCAVADYNHHHRLPKKLVSHVFMLVHRFLFVRFQVDLEACLGLKRFVFRSTILFIGVRSNITGHAQWSCLRLLNAATNKCSQTNEDQSKERGRMSSSRTLLSRSQSGYSRA